MRTLRETDFEYRDDLLDFVNRNPQYEIVTINTIQNGNGCIDHYELFYYE